MRISDGFNFIDCTLSGNYVLQQGTITETKSTNALSTFRPLQIIRVIDYFSKLDESKICRLQIIIRRIGEGDLLHEVIGNPEEIQQYMMNQKNNNGTANGASHPQKSIETAPKNRANPEVKPKPNEPAVKIESNMDIEPPVLQPIQTPLPPQ